MIAASHKLEFYYANIVRRLEGKKRRVLFKQGAYLRKTMQRSMRYSKNPSKPGKPPHARRYNPLLRQLITFDVEGDTVTCGPKLFTGSRVRSSKPLPELLDQGGTTEIGSPPVAVHIAPRPFTDPVFTDGGENFRKLIEGERL